ncbi:MAG: 16S rRNA (cytidine(1402)-2'-O)-methyltransferase, partial [Anaerolineae bacterium]|nr:16S rRNA (cytidine(1402)-2'-O)-methyltransferase [Anaerolineae bacterium]
LRDFSESIRAERGTLIAYESPNRLVETLETLRDLLGERRACVARELSKKFETFERGTLSEIADRFREKPPRGEITLVIAGAAEDTPAEWDAERVRAALHDRLAAGESLSSAARAVAAASGWNRRDVYALGIEG